MPRKIIRLWQVMQSGFRKALGWSVGVGGSGISTPKETQLQGVLCSLYRLKSESKLRVPVSLNGR
jgi:hypothetical protein